MSRNIHHYNNPDYNYHPCQRYRTHRLMFLNLQEIAFAQRMILSVVLGGVIGFERRASERPAGNTKFVCFYWCGSFNWLQCVLILIFFSQLTSAYLSFLYVGIRTMSMVCLGSCFFSMTGQLAFKSSTMGWDAARVAAAIPSGKSYYVHLLCLIGFGNNTI